MNITRTKTVEGAAEGDCCGIPYTTELHGPKGVAAHFWLGDVQRLNAMEEEALKRALRRLRAHRDVVAATWSPGLPYAYWTRTDIE